MTDERDFWWDFEFKGVRYVGAADTYQTALQGVVEQLSRNLPLVNALDLFEYQQIAAEAIVPPF